MSCEQVFNTVNMMFIVYVLIRWQNRSRLHWERNGSQYAKTFFGRQSVHVEGMKDLERSFEYYKRWIIKYIILSYLLLGSNTIILNGKNTMIYVIFMIKNTIRSLQAARKIILKYLIIYHFIYVILALSSIDIKG